MEYFIKENAIAAAFFSCHANATPCRFGLQGRVLQVG
jgi:hypothetical protein